MSRNFTLSCCSTVDVPYHYLESRSIPVLFYTYVVDDVTYVDDMGRDPQALPHFYEMLAAGKLPQTSQVNVAEYMAFFEELLKRGGDVLHLGFTSGQSGSIHNAFLAAEMLKEKYPEQKLLVVDTLCSSSGYGMLVDTVADMRDTGATVEEAYQWTMDNRNKVHHQFFSTDMTQFRRTGRVSGATAAIATVLNICPIMRLDSKGAIKAYDKVRGKHKAIEVTADTMEQHAQGGRDYDQRCWICHSQCLDLAKQLAEQLELRFPHLKDQIRIFDIGTIIGSHAGPGTVAVFFYGDERPEMA